MGSVAEILFEYLENAIYNPEEAVLDVEKLPYEFQKLGSRLQYFVECAASLEQGAILFDTLIKYVPQQIFVVEENTFKVLLMNDTAKSEIDKDSEYLMNFLEHRFKVGKTDKEQEIEVMYANGEHERHFVVKFYSIEWYNSNAEIIVVNDISATKTRMRVLETQAYNDDMTGLYNRAYGMLTLSKWLEERRQFVLVFIDLDKLKYVNDEFGHNEGDMYIINASNSLKAFSIDCVACRLGGDEFMLLVPNIGYVEAYATMNRIIESFKNHIYLRDKEYYYNMSFGIVAVDADNKLSANILLKTADERMYENKWKRKTNNPPSTSFFPEGFFLS